MNSRVAALVLVLVGVVALPSAERMPSESSFIAALDRYDDGNYDAAVQNVARISLSERSVADFENDAARWIKTGTPAETDRRTLVASALALELAHPRNGAQPGDPSGDPILLFSLRVRPIVFASNILKHPAGQPTSAERWWYLAAIATIERMEAWQILNGETESDPEFREFGALARQEGHGGLLAQALARFPDESRLKLAGLELSEVSDHGLLTNSSKIGGPRWPFVLDDACLAALSSLKASVAKPPSDPAFSGLWRAHLQAVTRTLAVIANLPRLQQDYEALSADEAVRAEAILRLGYLRARTCGYAGALAAFHEAGALTTDPFLLYLSHFLAGHVHEVMGQREAAVSEYEQALLIRPGAWSASLLLGAQLFLSDRSGDRQKAYDVIKNTGVGPAPDDPWRWFRSGDARLSLAYIAHLREALKR